MGRIRGSDKTQIRPAHKRIPLGKPVEMVIFTQSKRAAELLEDAGFPPYKIHRTDGMAKGWTFLLDVSAITAKPEEWEYYEAEVRNVNGLPLGRWGVRRRDGSEREMPVAIMFDGRTRKNRQTPPTTTARTCGDDSAESDSTL